MDRRARNIAIGIGSVVGGIAVGVGTIWLVAGPSARGLLPGVVEPRQVKGVPFALGGKRPVWPVISSSSRGNEVAYADINGDPHGNWERRFGANRDDHTHAGVDLYANNGDILVATENGTIIGAQTFHLGTDALLLQTDSGIVILYGEADPKSWKEFGIAKGSRVRAGQPIARVGCMVGTWKNCDSHMLHLETYIAGTEQNKRWTGSPPFGLLDPTRYLLRAQPVATA